SRRDDTVTLSLSIVVQSCDATMLGGQQPPDRGVADINIHGGTVLPALIPRRQVVVGNAFATLVEVFRFDLSRHCGGAAELRDEGIPGTVTPCLQGPRSRREVG